MSPTKATFLIETSPELDYSGYLLLRDEITESHPLRSQFVQSCDAVFGKERFAQVKSLSSQELRKSIEDFYSEHNSTIQATVSSTQKAWEERESPFLRACDELFSGKSLHEDAPWILYPSVLGVYLQNIKEKAISFPYRPQNTDEAIYVIIHELLHVFFYQYLDQYHKEFRQKIDASTMWHMSEIFNSVVLQLETYRAFYTDFTPSDYDDHEVEVKELSERLGDTFTADDFVNLYVERMTS